MIFQSKVSGLLGLLVVLIAGLFLQSEWRTQSACRYFFACCQRWNHPPQDDFYPVCLFYNAGNRLHKLQSCRQQHTFLFAIQDPLSCTPLLVGTHDSESLWRKNMGRNVEGIISRQVSQKSSQIKKEVDEVSSESFVSTYMEIYFCIIVSLKKALEKSWKGNREKECVHLLSLHLPHGQRKKSAACGTAPTVWS